MEKKNKIKTNSTTPKSQNKKVENKTPKKWFFSLLIIVFTFILYGNTLNHSYALDDNVVSRENTFVQKGISGIPLIFSKGFLYGFNRMNDQSYRPITLVTFAIEVGLWGNNPKVHHFFTILYYAICCMLLFILLKRLFKNYTPVLSFIITLIFIAHPIHTEAVANFKSRDEVLTLAFLLFSLIQLFKFIDFNKTSSLVCSIIFYFLALLTKEQAITFIAIAPLTIYFFSDIKIKRIILLTIPFIATAGLYMIIRANILDVVTFGEKMTIVNNSLVAATNTADRMATAIFILGKYLWLLILPYSLSWDYSYNQIPIVSFANQWVILTIIVFTFLSVFAVLRFRIKDIFSYSYMFFLISISVISNIFILIGSTLGERFLLTPSITFCIVLVFIIGKITRTEFGLQKIKSTYGFYVILSCILLLYSVKTIARNAEWKNNLTLFSASLKTCPNSSRVHTSVAYEYTELSKIEQNSIKRKEYFDLAIKEYLKALSIYDKLTDTWYNLGYNYFLMGNEVEAEKAYNRTIEIEPHYAKAYNNLGVINFNRKEYTKAIEFFTLTLKNDSLNIDALGNLGATYHNMGQYSKAYYYYKKVLSITPNNENIKSNLNLMKQTIEMSNTDSVPVNL